MRMTRMAAVLIGNPRCSSHDGRLSDAMYDRTIDDLRPEIERAYKQLWQRAFLGTPHQQAKLIVTDSMEDARYSPSRDEIILPVPGWGIQAEDRAEPENWPRWRGELVHEMAHEYAWKVKPQESAVSRRLARKQMPFDGCGHGEDFWAAVDAIARALGLDVDRMADAL